MSNTLVAQHSPVRRRALALTGGRIRATSHLARAARAARVGRARGERGAATAEYAIATVAACGLGGILIALLKSDAMQSLLQAIINAGLRAAGIDFQL